MEILKAMMSFEEAKKIYTITAKKKSIESFTEELLSTIFWQCSQKFSFVINNTGNFNRPCEQFSP